ncbi:alpha amylase C-terminal domain-containing protein [Capnocytophaga sp.]|uniref:alpha amylase C-terminal domain-containing protein n=1 Tax=Capnocytophaga sp. TaxID=44737 RepID=UPI0026DD6F9F|nr:alpha amylase C-terminal domain-containing protein [Capnocytophaga sp.]MDO5104987.1 alpha amylase C-terminal domain-containing protein [Capnocytophaga sp.]
MLPILKTDSLLQPFSNEIQARYAHFLQTEKMMRGDCVRLSDNLNSHLFYGLHFTDNQWILREWTPNATKIYLLFDKNDWQPDEKYAFRKIDNENWEIRLPASELSHGDLYKLYVEWQGGAAERIPSHVQRVVQDEYTKVFSAQVWKPTPYKWKNARPSHNEPPLIYEAHIGMSSELRKVATFTEFRFFVLPRIARLGYNTIQLMAIQEHPYYGSFGYQVANFFAVSSRFGTPEELKELIDSAHGLGIRVILDIVHSHSVSNESEGLGFFDGTDYLYFHSGERGKHPQWDSRLFDYGKPQVLNFLLSNCKYWLEEFQFDGFRFDGVTSMIYFDHGLGKAFTNYSLYYDGNQDVDAITYLTLANRVVHEIYPQAITVAEEMSGLPGLAFPIEGGGIGFDYKMSMGVPDYWIKLLEDYKDEDWHVGDIFYELTNKRAEERTISYAESHDQALVGDKTIFFRLADKEIYTGMSVFDRNLVIDRAISLHKMIRLVTIATAGGGYLAFMGNEWGHPEWIDFPREGNNWSYDHARRLWSLLDDENLKFKYLNNFDGAMIHFVKKNRLLEKEPSVLVRDNERQILAFERGGFLFVFNFNPSASFSDYEFEVEAGKYTYALCSDNRNFGGQNRIDETIEHFTQYKHKKNLISLYLPSRSAIVLKMNK